MLILPKWWPDEVHFHDGIFLRKHALAVKPWYRVACVHVHGADRNLTITDEDDIFTVRIGIGECRGYRKWFMMRAAYERGYREVKKALGKPVLVHAGVLVYPALFARWMRLLLGIPYVITEHWSGYITGEYRQSPWLKRWLTKRAVRGARAVMTPSQTLADAMMSCGLRGNYHVVPNVIDPVVPYTPAPRPDDKIRMMNLSDMWDDKKNVSGIIRATAQVVRDDPRFELHIIGDGRDREVLHRLSHELGVINKHVFFHGELPNREVYEFMKTIDFYITNSTVETFSIATAEAIACGKPVITTACGGPTEFVTREVGVVIPVSDDNALAAAMVSMATRLAEYEPAKLMAYAQHKFSYDVVGKMIAEVYRAAHRRL